MRSLHQEEREREKKKGNFFSQAIYYIALIYYVSNAFTTVVSFANYQHTDCKIMEIRMVTSIGIPVCYATYNLTLTSVSYQ